MAFPYEFVENFESGTKGNFDSESDDGKRLDFPHQSDLPRGMMPARGAFCCRVNLGKNSDPAYLEEAVNWSVDQMARWGRFRLFIGEDVQFGNDHDYVRILQFYSAVGPDTKEARIVLARIDPMGTILTAEMEGETWDAFTGQLKVPHGKWLDIEWKRTVGVGTSGTMVLILPQVGWSRSDRQTDAANVAFRLGATEQSGDLQGTIYFDNVIVDEDRLYDDPSPLNGELSGGSLFMVQNGFAFLGKGEIEHVTVIDAGSGDARVKVYDTDYPTRLPAGGLRYDLPVPAAGATAQSTSRRVPFKRGAYVELSGTNPQAIIRLGKVDSDRAAG